MSELASDLLFIIIVLVIAAVLGILIGYLIGLIQKKKEVHLMEKRIDGLEADLFTCERKKNEIELEANNSRKNLKKQITKLERELSSCKNEKIELDEKAKDLMQVFEEVKATDSATDLDFEPANDLLLKGARFTNLKIIEGVGPKIEQILKQEGLDTWIKLSLANPDDIRSILVSKGGSAYRIHDPKSWPHQAKLASEGKWKELKDYQDQLTGGK